MQPQKHPENRDVTRIATQESVKYTNENVQLVSSRALSTDFSSYDS